MTDLDKAIGPIETSMKAHLRNLKYRQTSGDPENNGYAYAEIPDWLLRQWVERLHNLRALKEKEQG